MKFGRRRMEEPEINLIPFIDVLLVVLIFLMLSTTYSRFTELQINLPAADAEKLRERPAEIIVAVAADGRFAINRRAVDGRSVEQLLKCGGLGLECRGSRLYGRRGDRLCRLRRGESEKAGNQG